MFFFFSFFCVILLLCCCRTIVFIRLKPDKTLTLTIQIHSYTNETFHSDMPLQYTKPNKIQYIHFHSVHIHTTTFASNKKFVLFFYFSSLHMYLLCILLSIWWLSDSKLTAFAFTDSTTLIQKNWLRICVYSHSTYIVYDDF